MIDIYMEDYDHINAGHYAGGSRVGIGENQRTLFKSGADEFIIRMQAIKHGTCKVEKIYREEHFIYEYECNKVIGEVCGQELYKVRVVISCNPVTQEYELVTMYPIP